MLDVEMFINGKENTFMPHNLVKSHHAVQTIVNYKKKKIVKSSVINRLIDLKKIIG